MNDEPRRSAFGDDAGSQVRKIMQRGREKQDEERPYAGRGKPAHAGKKGRDKEGRTKLTADLRPATRAAVDRLAADSGIGLSDLVEAALRGFAAGVEAGKIDLSPYQVHARSLKAEWSLELPDEFVFILE